MSPKIAASVSPRASATAIEASLAPIMRAHLRGLDDDLRADVNETDVRQLMAAEGLGFVVVPDAGQYAPSSWLRQDRDWLRRIELDANRYVLAIVA